MITTFSTSKLPPSDMEVSSGPSTEALEEASVSASSAGAAQGCRCLTNRPGDGAVDDRKLGVMNASQQTHRFLNAASEVANAAVASMRPLHL